ncbi:MAG: hypothetical protein AB1757_03365 [Acidobacteriota bacterium]
MKLPISPKIKSMSFRSFIALTAILGLLAMGYPQSGKDAVIRNQARSQTKTEGARKDKRLSNLKDPQAVAMFIHLLERYANNIADKTEMDKRLEQTLTKKKFNRERVRQLMANFQSIPLAERRAAFGQYGDIPLERKFSNQEYQTAFNRLTNTDISRYLQRSEPDERAPRVRSNSKHSKTEPPDSEPAPADVDKRKQQQKRKPLQRQPLNRSILNGSETPLVTYAGFMAPTDALMVRQDEPARYKLWYEGLRCRSDTDADNLSDADEIYIITTVVDASGNDWTTRHPRPHEPNWYTGVDSDETRTGPRRGCWGGGNGQLAQNLTLTVHLFEKDEGDPAEVEEAIRLMWATAGAICSATAHNTIVPCIVGLGIALVINVAINLFTGGEDDLVETKVKNISADDLRRWDNEDPHRRGNIFYHFSTNHQNNNDGGWTDGAAGADYQVYFRVTSILPFG